MSFDKVYEWDEMRWGKKKAEMRRIHSLLTPSRRVKLKKKKLSTGKPCSWLQCNFIDIILN